MDFVRHEYVDVFRAEKIYYQSWIPLLIPLPFISIFLSIGIHILREAGDDIFSAEGFVGIVVCLFAFGFGFFIVRQILKLKSDSRALIVFSWPEIFLRLQHPAYRSSEDTRWLKISDREIEWFRLRKETHKRRNRSKTTWSFFRFLELCPRNLSPIMREAIEGTLKSQKSTLLEFTDEGSLKWRMEFLSPS